MRHEVSYVQFCRTDVSKELMKNPKAFTLLAQIALRARRTNRFNINELIAGEALIGDFKSIGMSRQEYRTALKKLQKWGFVTIKTTNKGTIAMLCNSDVFNINIESKNHQTSHSVTSRQPSSNQRATTNKNDKKVNNDKNVKYDKSKFKFFPKKNKSRYELDSENDYSEEF